MSNKKNVQHRTLLVLLSKRGSILANMLVLFLLFLSVYTPLMMLGVHRKIQPTLQAQAFKRMDMEIEALAYYQSNKEDLRHDDAMYAFNHWITYWFKEDKMIIWFDGYYDYELHIIMNDEGKFINKTYKYDY